MADSDESRCTELRDDLAAFALGALAGAERAAMLAHLETCSSCARELARMTRAVDSLVLLVPEAAPPIGFGRGLRQAMRAERQATHRLRRRVVVLVSAVALVGAGLGAGLGLSSSARPSDLSYVFEAHFRATSSLRGDAYLTKGAYPWLLVTVEDGNETIRLRCVVTTRSGARVSLGTFALHDGHGSWATSLSAPSSSITSIEMVGMNGRVLAQASLG